MPIAVRYTQDAFSRSGWLWPVDAKGEPLKATSYMAVGFSVAKYVNKKADMDLAAKGLGAKEWNNSLKTKLSLLPKKLFRIRMSRNFGMKMLTMTNLSTECLIQITKLGYDATPRTMNSENGLTMPTTRIFPISMKTRTPMPQVTFTALALMETPTRAMASTRDSRGEAPWRSSSWKRAIRNTQ